MPMSLDAEQFDSFMDMERLKLPLLSTVISFLLALTLVLLGYREPTLLRYFLR